MKIQSRTVTFLRSLMAGLFTGIIAGAASFLYVFIYRSAIGVEAYDMVISPLLIFLGFPILLTFMGLLFFGMKWYLRKGAALYSVLILWLTVFALGANLLAPGEISLSGYKGLLFGIESITGIMSAFLLPYLARYSKFFITQQGLRVSR